MCAAGCDAQHEIYGKVRTASEFVERLGKERELRIEAVAKVRAEGGSVADAIALSEDSWLLNDAAWGASLHLTPEQVVTGDSAVFLAWIPGGLLGGGLCDAVGRKRASLGCAVLIALALVGTALVLPGDGGALIASRALAGLGIGGFMASAPTMLVESVDAGAKGRATLAWSAGYVAALALLAAVHLGLAAG